MPGESSPSDRPRSLERSEYLPSPDPRTVGGAAAVFGAVLVVYYALPPAARTDAVQVPLTVGAVLAVGFLLAVPDRDAPLVPTRAPLACGLGGALCTLVVAFEAARRGPGFVPIVAASAVVLPTLFAGLGAVGAVCRQICSRVER